MPPAPTIKLNSPLQPDLKRVTEYLEGVHARGWYTNFGTLQEQLADRLADYLGVEHLLLLNNGTTALQVAARALDCRRLLTTPFSFVATASAYLWQGDEISFADIERNSYNLSPDKADEALEKSAHDAVVATHVYGNPCDVNAFEELRSRRGVKVIYDAAHAFGVRVGGESVLSFGDASALSFHATKVFHTIEGGAAVFRDKDAYERARGMINFGITPGKGVLDTGLNGKLNEYQAAVGLVLLDGMDEVLERRAEVFTYYREQLADLVELPKWHPEATLNGAYMPIWLGSASTAEMARKALLEAGIESRHYFYPSLDQVFPDVESHGVGSSRELADGILCLPMHIDMSKAAVDRVAAELRRCL